MTSNRPVLEMPSWVHGSWSEAHHKAVAEGQRCARLHEQEGAFPAPSELLEVPAGGLVITRSVVDFIRDRPAWRLFMVGSILDSMCDAVGWRDYERLCDLYEAFALPTPWGALYYATAHIEPMGAASVALRIEWVLRFWEQLEQARYLFSSPSAVRTLDELMMDACGWTMCAWCPEERGPLRERLAIASGRMARATREDSIEAVLRQLPLTLSTARGLKHPDVLVAPGLWYERLAALGTQEFQRISAAWPSSILNRVYAWDKELQQQE